jgi:hypothetical protein
MNHHNISFKHLFYVEAAEALNQESKCNTEMEIEVGNDEFPITDVTKYNEGTYRKGTKDKNLGN